MEVPHWAGLPEEDYPALSIPVAVASSDNARKKAKRKRKQQQDQLQALVKQPIQLTRANESSGATAATRKRARGLPIALHSSVCSGLSGMQTHKQ